MSRWIAALALAMFGCVSLVSAQGFSATLYYAYTGGDPLYTTCEGTTPIEDGRLVKIFHDVDEDGPDDTDPQPILCDVPPNCETGPAGTHNYNQFTMNGLVLLGEAGYFGTEVNFTGVFNMPPTPTYYLRVYEPDGTTVLWTSSVKTMAIGPQEITWSRAEWTCGSGGPQCVVRDEQE
ncbi:hypothetical protein KKH27_11250 [bacterium]|nr:hypothetical protein [bacterium]MBU1984987.1 hypothetical protein [bacterium]